MMLALAGSAIGSRFIAALLLCLAAIFRLSWRTKNFSSVVRESPVGPHAIDARARGPTKSPRRSSR
jgi:hypothetical protein